MTHVVGIDVSKAKLDCLWLRDAVTLKVKTKVVTNDAKGQRTLQQWLLKTLKANSEDILVVMEATGVYHEQVAEALVDGGFQVAVVNPAHIKSYAKSLGNIHKTDKQDSLIIARFGAERRPALWQPEALEIRELKALITRLEALETDYQRELNRLEKNEQRTTSSPTVITSIQHMIQELANAKRRIEDEIDDHIDRHPRLKQDKALLESIPGVGKVVSRVMLAVIHSRGFTSARQVAAYLGLIPVLIESGVFKGRSALSKRGPASVRARLYMAAVVASRYNPDVAAMKRRLLANGKNNMQAIGAAMRKLVHICYGVINSQTEYSPQAG